MKKARFLKIALIAVIVVLTLSCLFACGGKKLTITLMDGDSTIDTLAVDVGSTPDIPNPEKEGYTFVGWYTDKELTKAYDVGEVNDNLVLYAKFANATTVKYITVNSDGGSAVERVQVGSDGTYSVAAPTKEGYTFVGYTYVDTEGEKHDFPLSGTYPLAGSIKITANWRVNTYTVTFMNGATKVKDAEAEYQKTVSLPGVSKTGYTFAGWFTEGDAAFTDDTKVSANITVYARFEAKSFNISFDADGGSAVADKAVTYDAAYTLSEPTKTGYDFAGWTLNGEAFPLSGNYTVDGNARLKANWTQKTYSVTLKAFEGGATLQTQQSIAHGGKFQAYSGVEAGYEVVGYYLDNTDENSKITDINAYQVVNNVTVYVKVAAKTFNITVQGYDADTTATYKGAYSLPAAPVKEGYNFINYTLNGEPFPASGTYTWTTDIMVIAHFERDPMYGKVTVSLVSVIEGQKKSMGEKVIEGGATVDLTAVNTLAAGYDFVGWYHGMTTESTAYAAADTFDDDAVLYAIYAKHTYTISVSRDGGEGASSVTADYLTAYTLPTLTKRGYTFAGYTYDGSSIAISGTYEWTENITVVAHWNRDTVEVTFMGSDGTTYSTETAYLYEALTAYLPATNPVKTGHTFTHWALAEGGEEYNSTAELTENLTLYPVYSANSYQITVNGTGYSVTYGGLYSLPVPVDNENWQVFKTYKRGEEDFPREGTYTIADNVTLTIEWQADTRERLIEGNNYFRELFNSGEEYTYVFLTGVEYDFSSDGATVRVSQGAPVTTINDSKFIANSVGSFTFEYMKDGQTGTRNAIVVNYINLFGMGNNYNSVVANAADSTLYKVTAASADYVMDVGQANFIPDLTIVKNGNVAITFAEANMNVVVKENGVAVSTDLYGVNGNSIGFADALLGKTLTVEFRPKYALTANSIPTLTIKVKVNNGVNVYSSSELRAAYADLNVHTVNVLRNIQATLLASDYAPGHGEAYADVTLNNGDNSKTYTLTNQNVGVPINDFNHGAYVRIADAQNHLNDSITVNGNYFEIDGSKLPYIDNRYDRYGASGSPFTDGNSYRISNTQIGIFLYRTVDLYANGDTYRRYSNGQLNMNNLRVEGNYRSDLAAYSQDLGEGLSLLKMSSAYIGIVIRGGTANLNNVTIFDTEMAMMMDGGVSGLSAADYLAAQNKEGQTHAAIANYDNCIIDRSWANSVYVYNISKLTMTNSKIGSSCGGAIHIDDVPHPKKATELSTEVTLDMYTAANINNWVSGEEAWFVAYGQSGTALTMKFGIDQQLQEQSAPLTNVKTFNDGGTPTVKMNFAIFLRSAGSYSTEDWKTGNGDVNNADAQGHPSAIFQTVGDGEVFFYGSAAEMASAASGQPYFTTAIGEKDEDNNETPNNVMAVYIPLYRRAAESQTPKIAAPQGAAFFALHATQKIARGLEGALRLELESPCPHPRGRSYAPIG